MKKLLSMLLAAAMLVSASAMAFAEGTSEKGTIVYGSSTEIGGDFAPDSWWTNNATDKMIRNLTNDYTVTTTNQGGEFVVNPGPSPTTSSPSSTRMAARRSPSPSTRV